MFNKKDSYNSLNLSLSKHLVVLTFTTSNKLSVGVLIKEKEAGKGYSSVFVLEKIIYLIWKLYFYLKNESEVFCHADG